MASEQESTSEELVDNKDVATGTGRTRLPVLFGLISLLIYIAITLASRQFHFSDNLEDLQARPILLVLTLFGANFLIYLGAIYWVLKRPESRFRLKAMVFFAVLFRLVVFFSTPIQEVDIYRYLWDGEVCTHGISPFRFAPQTVIDAIGSRTGHADLDYLADHCDQNPELQKLLDRVHFENLPTVYPPTSQVVFAASSWMTPDHVSVETRVLIMKAWLIGFDLATLGLVIRLLTLCSLNPSLSVVYGWCPLLIKEISNSGHLDSIATFLTALAVFWLVRSICSQQDGAQPMYSRGRLLASSFTLALAVGAKIFPVVLVPLFSWVVWKRVGWQAVLQSGILFLVVFVALAAPMVSRNGLNDGLNEGAGNPQTSVAATDPSRGLETFFKYWEMNDLLFMIVVENLKEESRFPANEGIWFSAIPSEWRTSVSNLTDELSIPANEGPFLVARALTSIAFLGFALLIAWRAGNQPSAKTLLEAAFLTLAGFWFLSPTQNPWYWTWTLPFLPFVNRRAWYLVSGLTMLYYLRFWFDYHFGQETIVKLGGRNYVGTEFFDYFLPWVEFGPILLWIWGSRLIKFRKSNKVD